MEMKNDYEDDGVPGQGKMLSDGTYWTQSSVAVGTRSGQHVCVESRRFGSHTYARWQRA